MGTETPEAWAPGAEQPSTTGLSGAWCLQNWRAQSVSACLAQSSRCYRIVNISARRHYQIQKTKQAYLPRYVVEWKLLSTWLWLLLLCSNFYISQRPLMATSYFLHSDHETKSPGQGFREGNMLRTVYARSQSDLNTRKFEPSIDHRTQK